MTDLLSNEKLREVPSNSLESLKVPSTEGAMKMNAFLIASRVALALACALCFAAGPAEGQSTLKFTEWAVPTSSNCPFGVFPVSKNVVYFAEAVCSDTVGRIGKLDAATNVITEWSGTTLVNPPQGLIALGGSILFTDGGANTISMLNPKTNRLKSWAVPFSGPLNLVAVGTKIFFTEIGSGKIGMLDLPTNNITEWGGLAGPLDIAASEDGSHIWFSQVGAPQLGRLDPDDNTFQQWTLPSSVSGHHVQHIAVPDEDHIFFVDDFTGSVGRLDPDASVVTAWATPSPTAGPVDLEVRELTEGYFEGPESFRVDFSESAGNKIARLLTALQTGTNTSVLSTTTVVTPTVTLVKPSTSTLTPSSTVVTPVITNVTGVITGGFEEWLVPTVNSNNYAIAELPGGGLAFSEANGNKIGTLRSPWIGRGDGYR